MTWQNQQNDCVPIEDSDQPGHPPSLIRVFAVRMKKTSVLSYPLSAQRRLIRLGKCPGWSESSLGVHSLCWFCHVTAYFMCPNSYNFYNGSNVPRKQCFFCLFWFNDAFNTFSDISRLCLVATGSSVLTFTVLPHRSIMPQTLDMIPHSVTLSWHWVHQS